MMNINTGVTTFGGRGLKLAGTTATFDGRLDEKGWQVKGRTGTTTVEALRKFAAPWFELPKDITGDGKVAIEGSAADAGDGTMVDATLNLDAVTLTNEASTIVTDNLAAVVRLRARLNDADTAARTQRDRQTGTGAGESRAARFRQESADAGIARDAERRSADDRIAAAHADGSHRAHGHRQREPGGRGSERQRRLPAREAPVSRRVHELHADHAGHHQRAQRPQDER